MDLMGDIGGVMEVLIFIFGFALFPMTEYSFYLSAIQEIFKVKTKEWKSDCQEIETIENKDYDFDHQNIKLSGYQMFKLFFLEKLSFLVCDCCWSREKRIENTKLIKLYERGIDRLDGELSIDYIIQLLGKTKTLLKMPINQNKTLK